MTDHITPCCACARGIKITAGHWPFSMHICQMAKPYDNATIPVNAFADMLTSLHVLCGNLYNLLRGITVTYPMADPPALGSANTVEWTIQTDAH